jgi:hypothetical protein
MVTTIHLTEVKVTHPERDHVRDLQHCIEDVSRLRYSLVHECGHLLLADSHHEQNSTGSTALIESLQWLTRLVAADNWLTVPPIDAGSASAVPASLLNGARFGPRSVSTTAPVWTTPPPHRQHTMHRLG